MLLYSPEESPSVSQHPSLSSSFPFWSDNPNPHSWPVRRGLPASWVMWWGHTWLGFWHMRLHQRPLWRFPRLRWSVFGHCDSISGCFHLIMSHVYERVTYAIGGFGFRLTCSIIRISLSWVAWQYSSGDSPGTGEFSSKTRWSLPKKDKPLDATRVLKSKVRSPL